MKSVLMISFTKRKALLTYVHFFHFPLIRCDALNLCSFNKVRSEV
jgi:hypothetical protein